MQETIEQMSTQVNERWNGLSKTRKIQLGIGTVLLVLTIAIATFILTRPNMTLLYNQNLETKQIAEVVEVLQAQGISYNLVHNGLNIEVEQGKLNAAKIALATEDVPKGGYTFADAMNNTMSTTESEREAKMQRLTEVNLENMLMGMSAIQEADVSLVVPEEKNAFIASKQESSASVLLKTAQSLSTKQVEGIARLISSSVTNLDMKNINIMDTEGNSLYIGDDEATLTTNKQQELKFTAEADISNKIRQLLEPIYDEIRISPNLVLDFNHYEEVREEYIPQETGKGLPSKEVTQSSTSTNTPNQGVVGTPENGGDAPNYQLGSGSASESKTQNQDIEYVNNKVVSNAIKNIGDIDYKKSSLAVHVFKERVYREADIANTLDENMTWAMFKEQNKNNIPIIVDEGIVASIQNGTGIDNVVVYGYEKPVFIGEEPYVIDYKDYIPYGLILLVIIIMIFVVLRFRKQDEAVETEPELEIEEMLSVAREDLELEDIELKETLETKRRIEKFVDEKPEAVASLLRNWLNDDDWG